MNGPKLCKLRFWAGLLLAPLAVALVLLPGSVYANDEVIIIRNTEERETLTQYWTPERMRKAIPMGLLEAKDCPGYLDDTPLYSPKWSH